ncbi:DUF3040 domain-containing protein [Pseudarthrobacter sp. fls2-241-R2A-168]|uniref:DUF3040 domain-containing protein n=1 Tax=Pseudarthrobacter sp. fls2-241-R2A-168 TaxID=3040304 RepID=UPI002553CC0A|nr:DUF3040 domain-containing protein [Pseudarthrobacter sp. fls2-241-R2A-168]
MPLSEHEQKLLEQLEKQLHADDPKFASTMQSDPIRSWSARHVIVGVLGAIAGILLLLVGVSTQLIVVGVLGFVVMSGGVYVATLRGTSFGKSKTGKAEQSRSRTSFMINLEERWDERRRDNN